MVRWEIAVGPKVPGMEVRYAILDISRDAGTVPLKTVGVVQVGDRLCRLSPDPEPLRFEKEVFDTISDGAQMEPNAFNEVEKQLLQYLSGKRRKFSIPLRFVEGTQFQQNIWNALLRIPFGVTRSYGEIARSVGSPRAARAVGSSCGANPIAIIVPCHRVVGSSGGLVGFGGGLPLKRALLELEGAI